MQQSFTHNGYTFYATFRNGACDIESPTGYVMARISATAPDQLQAWIKEAKLSGELTTVVEAFGFKGQAATSYKI